ncbi:hypothetical protein XELAEV_18016351mg, partial [Xenopus laevis]
KQKEILKKIDVLERTSDHGKIVGFHGAYYHPASKKMPHFEGLWVSTELYTGASLKDLTNIQKQKSLPESSENDICKEVLQGPSHLDENKVIDHHLSPDNIMVDSSRDINIRDFSSATIGLRSPTTFREAIPYRAPELKANVGSNTIANTTKVLSDKFHFFISECLQKNPARRPSAEQLLAHPFISNIQNERGVKKFIKRHLQKCKGTAHSHYNSLH